MRAARLLSDNEKGRVCAVTFTRDAAAELKDRILLLCGVEQAQRLAVGTFHSIALSQLRRLKQFKNIKLLSDGERMGLLRRCYRHYNCKVPFEKVVSAIDKAKSRLESPVFSEPAIEDIFNAYQSLLDTERGMDFSDILLYAVRGLKDGSVEPLAVRWLLADEFQDADELQTQWVIEHGAAGVEVTIVGDDDQSLYSFRNALGYEGMQRVSQFLSAQEITLPINYRCAPNILERAATLIANNPKRANKTIQAERTTVGRISVLRAANRVDEAKLITAAIKESPGLTWAVLARSNSLLDPIELDLKQNGVAHRLASGKSVWDGIVGSSFLSLLKSVHNDSWTGFANVLAVCGIQPELLNLNSNHKNGLQIIRNIHDCLSDDDVSAKKAVFALISGCDEWRSMLARDGESAAIQSIVGWLRIYIKPVITDKKRAEERDTLLVNLSNCVANLKGTIPQRLAALQRSSIPTPDCKVVLSTLHSSKGLEFDCVWILGVEDIHLPHPDSTEDEERRLFYVGITRARNRLVISGSLDAGPESRFVREAGF